MLLIMPIDHYLYLHVSDTSEKLLSVKQNKTSAGKESSNIPGMNYKAQKVEPVVHNTPSTLPKNQQVMFCKVSKF